MDFSAGIRQLLFCARDTLGSNELSYPVFLGVGNEGKYLITDKTVKGYRDEDIPSMVNHKIEMKTFQMDFFILSRLIFHCSQRGADCQIVTEKTAANNYGGVYNFTGNDFLGIDFEWKHTDKESSLSVTGEVSLSDLASSSLICAAQTNVPIDIPEVDPQYGHRGIDLQLVRTPKFGSVQSPGGNALVNGHEVIERNFVIKTVSSKLASDRSSVKWLKVILDLTIDKSTASALSGYLGRAKNSALVFQEKTAAGSFFTYNFGSDLFFRKHELSIDKESSFIKLSFEKNIPLYEPIIDTSASIFSVSSVV